MKKLTAPEAVALLKKLSTVQVLCIGDVMLDRFLYGKVDRISPEAPVPVVHVSQEIEMLGGAGNVAQNISSLEASVHFVSVIGDDTAGAKIETLLASLKTATAFFDKQAHQATTVKTRIIAERQQLVRVDRENSLSLNTEQQKELFHTIKKALAKSDVVILSDYGKGVLNPSLNADIIKEAQALNIPVVVDPKSTYYGDYAGASFITPNLKEFQNACQRENIGAGEKTNGDNGIHEAAQTLMNSHSLKGLLVTRSQDGMSLIDETTHAHITTKAQEVFDVSGAGDTVVALFSLALGAGLSSTQAAQLANAAAGIVVGKVGTAMVSPADLIKALTHGDNKTNGGEIDINTIPSCAHSHSSWEDALTQVLQWRAEGKKVGFTNGCFDILHPGHTTLLAQTKAQCDKLILGLNSDASVTKLKGPTRPVNTQDARAQVLLALESIDLVVVFDEDTPLKLLKHLKPDLLIKGADYTLDQVIGAKEVQQWGGKVCLVDLVPGHSTTNTIKRFTPSA
ncbi:MAG TPA: bifunctional heptose 7-phosphate kinase/heptose 1-phosphate adenyltransferase [Holosporales bacterium]|nr:bifunctional heptose 7-phosphate kinase/heptose 1-phosphate adenyltransferase [Holosporales bacterium]